MPQEEHQPQPETTHYPEVVSKIDVQQPELQEASSEQQFRTPEGYLEIEQETREIQQALALDFEIWASELTDRELRDKAKPHIDALNQERANDPVVLETASRQFLQHIIRPRWHEHFPKDESEPEELRWKEFLAQWPDHLQDNLEELVLADAEMREQITDLDLMRQVVEIREERLEIMRSASDYLGVERTLRKLSARAVAIRAQAALSNRGLTRRETKNLALISEHEASARTRQGEALTGEGVIEEIAKRRALKDTRDLQKGLLLTDSMQENIDYVLPSLVAGKPVLFVGDTGGAKTALAEFISREYFGVEPELISGHAEVNSYQLMGKTGLRSADKWTEDDLEGAIDQIIQEGGAQYDKVTPELRTTLRPQAIERLKARTGTVSDFDAGPMLRAMQEGKPIILDEINAIPPDFTKRLNKILQLRPGDTYVPQEDSGQAIKIQPGFCIIATLNEKSKRYKGVEDLSVEIQNRFGANVVRILYPDQQVADGQVPKDNLRLALAFLRDRSGDIDPDIDLTEVGNFVRGAHVTQKLFTGSDIPNYVPSNVVRDGLKEAVIAPRTMIDILSKAKEGQSLTEALKHFIAGFKNQSDQDALKVILEKHHFEFGDN